MKIVTNLLLSLILFIISQFAWADFSPHAHEVFLKFETILRLEIGLADNVISKEEKKKFFKISRSSKYILNEGVVWVPKTKFRVSSKTGNQIDLEDEYGDTQKRRDYIRDKIREQADYISGVFQSRTFLEKLDPNNQVGLQDEMGFGSLGETPTISIFVDEINQDETIIRYKYRVRALILKKLFKATETSELLKKTNFRKDGRDSVLIEVVLPETLDEVLIYGDEDKNFLSECTDHHYTSFGDFWYFFDPFTDACKKQMKKMRKDKYFKNVEVLLQIANKKEDTEPLTYPQYDILYKQPGMRFDILIGTADEPYWGDLTSQDDLLYELENDRRYMFDLRSNKADQGYVDFVGTAKKLKELGFKLDKDSLKEFTYGMLWEDEGEGSYIFPRDPERALESFFRRSQYSLGINFKARYLKKVRVQQKIKGEIKRVTKTLVVNLIFTDPQINSKDSTFSILWKDALENADFILYGGHSGLGANLNVSFVNQRMVNTLGIEGIKYTKKDYQIIYFNGCSTYGYYNRQYFKKKKGAKHLEIISSGLQTSYGDTPGNNMAMIESFVNYRFDSYKKIMTKLEASNTEPVLLTIKGDKDNPQETQTFCEAGVKVKACQ